MELFTIILFITILLVSLYAGFMIAYVVSVNPALAKLDHRTYLLTMQSINTAIINPLFMILFLGTVISLIILTTQASGSALLLSLLSSIIFIIFNHGVTFTQNIPLNNKLDDFSIESANVEEIEEMYSYFQKPWNFWHNIRTVTATLSVIPLLLITSL